MDQKSQSAIVIGSDHAGWEMKEKVKSYLAGKGVQVTDLSEPVYDKTDDYPKYAFKVAKAVAGGQFTRGIAVCGSGIGASMAANRVKGVRAALCLTEEMAKLSKQHNNANVLVLGGRITPEDKVMRIVDSWFVTEFEGGRHEARIKMLDE